MTEVIFLIGRVLFGGFFLINGVNHFKNFASLKAYAESRKVPSADWAVRVSGLMILLGGLGVLLGVFVKLSSLLIVIFLLTVTFKMHDYWNDQDPSTKMVNQVNFMKNMALLGAALMLTADF